MKPPLFDLLGLGCTAVDDLLYVESYPPANTKARVVRCESQCGGLTGTALVTAARLGAHCAYAGCLGRDHNSRLVEENFADEHIDTSNAPRAAAYSVGHSTIVVSLDTGSRNVFSRASGLIGAHESLPPDEIIKGTRVVLVDHHGVRGAIRAAEIARAAKIPIVADFERSDSPEFSRLLAVVDHLILSEEFAVRLAGSASAADAVRALWNADRATVIVTCGARGCWVGSSRGSPDFFPAFSVRARDTTGCGDVFHGAYAAGLAFGMDIDHRLHLASAAAALRAARRCGRDGIPRRVQVEEFLARHLAKPLELPLKPATTRE